MSESTPIPRRRVVQVESVATADIARTPAKPQASTENVGIHERIDPPTQPTANLESHRSARSRSMSLEQMMVGPGDRDRIGRRRVVMT